MVKGTPKQLFALPQRGLGSLPTRDVSGAEYNASHARDIEQIGANPFEVTPGSIAVTDAQFENRGFLCSIYTRGDCPLQRCDVVGVDDVIRTSSEQFSRAI